jgi:hypothetical protein
MVVHESAAPRRARETRSSPADAHAPRCLRAAACALLQTRDLGAQHLERIAGRRGRRARCLRREAAASACAK